MTAGQVVACLLAALALGCDASPRQPSEAPGASGSVGAPDEPAASPETTRTGDAPETTRAEPTSAEGESSQAGPAGESSQAESGSSETFADTAVKTPAEYLREPAFAAADFSRGELLSYACRACHALSPDELNPLGPNLSGVFGRRAGSTSFTYSSALQSADLVWTPAALDAWLAQPEAFIPGNNMAFTGYRSASDRRDLIAYLLRETSQLN